jgi:hypothetical protein
MERYSLTNIVGFAGKRQTIELCCIHWKWIRLEVIWVLCALGGQKKISVIYEFWLKTGFNDRGRI